MDNLHISILPLPYFIASKFSAFKNRGKLDPRTSHDFEDIVYILDNRIDIKTPIINASETVRNFLIEELGKLLTDKNCLEAIEGNLPYYNRNYRYKKILNTIKAIINNSQ